MCVIKGMNNMWLKICTSFDYGAYSVGYLANNRLRMKIELHMPV